MLRLALISSIVILAVADSPNQSATGSCEGAGATIDTGEISGLARPALPHAACLVTVFVSGSNARAAVHDKAGAVRPNPFPSNPDGAWFFSAVRGRYDVRFSGPASPGDSVAEAVRCGAPDDTAAIQTILNTRRFARFAPGVCVVGPLFVRSDTVIELAPATVLQTRPGYAEGQSLLTIADAANVTIRGHGGALAMNRAEYTSGEQRYALIIQGSSNVSVEQLTASGAGGDGFYIGAGATHPYSENVELRHCVADHNRRNGLSIVSGKNVLIDGGEFRETQGTMPEAGIDVEPDEPWQRAENIRIRGVLTRHSRGGGFLVAPSGTGDPAGRRDLARNRRTHFAKRRRERSRRRDPAGAARSAFPFDARNRRRDPRVECADRESEFVGSGGQPLGAGGAARRVSECGGL